MDWRTAYLTQAKSDYAMLLKFIREEAPLCHRLHYLQMTTEKMAKGFLTPRGGNRYPKTHDAFRRFVQIAGGRPEFRAASHYTQARPFATYIARLGDTAQKVENLSPEGDDHPNPEYLWEEKGTILLPTEYAFGDLALENPKMVKLLQFIADCFTLA